MLLILVWCAHVSVYACQGNLRFEKESDVVTLAAISLIVNLGDDYETGNVLEYLPAYARDRHPADTWKQMVLKRCDTPELGREVSPSMEL